MIINLSSMKYADPDFARLPVQPTHVRNEGFTPQVRYCPSELSRPEVQQLIQKVPNTRWDRGLQSGTTPYARCWFSDLSHHHRPLVGQIVRAILTGTLCEAFNGGAFPDNLLTELKRDARQFDVDVAIARRDFGDGGTLWLLAWSPRWFRLSPAQRSEHRPGVLRREQ